MVLVHPDFRRRGLATALLEHCLHYLLDEKRIDCVKLDATPDGKKVYEKLGFQDEFALARWEGLTMKQESSRRVRPANSVTIGELDTRAFGVDRIKFLQLLGTDSENTIANKNGFGMIRDGSNAHYLGPVVANSITSGRSLVLDLIQTKSRDPVFWDIPEDNTPAVALAEELGFQRQRELHPHVGRPQPHPPLLHPAMGHRLPRNRVRWRTQPC